MPDKNIWVFFDEFNTTFELGIIKEIFVERTCEGVPIPKNVRLLAACNAWRKRTKLPNNVGLVKNKEKFSKAYLVNKIPESLMEYIIDFG